MSFKFEISGKITRGHSLEALSTSLTKWFSLLLVRVSQPRLVLKDLFGGEIFKMKGITRRLLFQQMSETGPFDSNFKIGKSLT